MTVNEVMSFLADQPTDAEVRIGASWLRVNKRRLSFKNSDEYQRVKEWRKNNPDKDIERCVREFFRNKRIKPEDIPADLFKMKCEQMKLNRKVKAV